MTSPPAYIGKGPGGDKIGVILPDPPDYGQATPVQTSLFTVGDMINQVTRQFGDEANVQINNTDIIRWANMGIVEIARTNRIWEKTAVINSMKPAGTLTSVNPDGSKVIDTTQYTIPLPNDCVMLQAVSFNGMIIPGFDFEQLMNKVSGDMTVTGTPTCYYMWAGGINFYPYPDTADINVAIYYRGIPPFVSAIGDKFPIPDKYFDTLTAFVMKKAYELDEDWQGQKIQQGAFDSSLNQLSEEVDAYAGDPYIITDPIYESGGW